MALALVLVLVLAALVTAQHNLTTLDDFFLDAFGMHLREFSSGVLADVRTYLQRSHDTFPGGRSPLPMAEELLEYKKTLEEKMALGFATSLENVTALSLYGACSGPEDLVVTCVRDAVRRRLRTAAEVTLEELARDCAERRLALCSAAADGDCTSAYERRLRQLLVDFVDDATDDRGGSTPPAIIRRLIMQTVLRMSQVLLSTDTFLTLMAHQTEYSPSLEPFTFENLIQPWNNEAMKSVPVNRGENTTRSQEGLTWGVVRSSTGTVYVPCSYFRYVYSRTSGHFTSLVYRCYYQSLVQAHSQLLLCAMRPASRPLILRKAAPALYFSSRCLCLASNGVDCGVEAGVDPESHCLSVLLEDLQRRVWFRPAVTYLDYAFQTRVPVCEFADLLRVAFKGLCDDFHVTSRLDWILSSKCYYEGLVNKDLGCPVTLDPGALNRSALCAVKFFMHHVICEGDDDPTELRVPYYGVGQSPLVQALTWLDVAARLLTLVTYLACARLRNLPGKLLACYLLTALLRPLVVRAALPRAPALAVRLDVAADLSSTLWLSAYLHFLTSCIKTLRLPDSLTPAESRLVVLRYALLGWATPATLSVAFFTLDDFLESRVQVGQLLFVLCNYAALSTNLYMFRHNFCFYRDVRSAAEELRRTPRARGVLADLFNFALKTSLLSGAGITVRLVLTQTQGLEQLLGVYHVLGSLQGLLVFLFYGCNRKAQAFWLGVVLRCRPTSA